MNWRKAVLAGVACMGLTGCIATSYKENAALRMTKLEHSDPALDPFVAPDKDYPSAGGDILKGASPAEQAAARDAAAAPPPPKP
jgi:hypothetical protein